MLIWIWSTNTISLVTFCQPLGSEPTFPSPSCSTFTANPRLSLDEYVHTVYRKSTYVYIIQLFICIEICGHTHIYIYIYLEKTRYIYICDIKKINNIKIDIPLIPHVKPNQTSNPSSLFRLNAAKVLLWSSAKTSLSSGAAGDSQKKRHSNPCNPPQAQWIAKILIFCLKNNTTFDNQLLVFAKVFLQFATEVQELARFSFRISLTLWFAVENEPPK